ncbi:MAG: flagellar biosynthetic protein FliR [Pseudomonadota bacterium]
MTGILAALQDLMGGALAGAGFVFLRIGAAMALLPAFGERSIPLRVRLVLVIAFTMIVLPAVLDRFPETSAGPDIWRLAAVEVFAGLAIGSVLRLMVLVLQMAGTIAANVTSLSQIIGGASVDPQPAIAHVLVVGGLALAAMAGLHVKAAAAIILSYEVFPPGELIPADGFAAWGADRVAHAFALAFTLSAPFVLVSVVYNLALGAINRAMPQLMVAFVGAPAITMAALVLMALSAPFLLGLWSVAFDAALSGLGTR